MNKRYSLVVIMILLSLLLGGCSPMTDQSTEKQEMIQIAESQKMKVAIESYLKNLDPEALTPNGKIKSYRILKDKLKYNPMEGIIVEIVTNRDDRLTIDMTVIEEDSGEYLVATSGTPKELTKLIERDKQ
ncbi:hypothetical protein HMPREF3002_00770 [Streptococcus sp. HMSC065E03]|uniref:DUF1310 family protein n=1 Tax=Streptococcus sp. HMSC065E03 TaxID=1739505 RepID=UPI0008A346D3|nr:DUF1310 family protein [Streptococcus sp. HMSC065E03]MBS5355617.1 DUF1310 family protein [Streptococcus parasanguinis]OFP07937.1 hypothetical protein HMPREF3002_00770 [Streptococcus sp. HMSC065E03]